MINLKTLKLFLRLIDSTWLRKCQKIEKNLVSQIPCRGHVSNYLLCLNPPKIKLCSVFELDKLFNRSNLFVHWDFIMLMFWVKLIKQTSQSTQTSACLATTREMRILFKMWLFVTWILELTNVKLGCKAAACDSQVMGVLLSMQQVNVRIPEFEIPVGAASDKHLAAGREAAGHHTGLAHRAASGNSSAGRTREEQQVLPAN